MINLFVETYPYDGRLSPDQLNYDGNEGNEDMEFIDEDMNNPYEIQQRQRDNDYRHGGYGYEQDERVDRGRGGGGGGGGYREPNGRYAGGGRRDDYNPNQRPKTGGKKSSNVDTSYYLDDPNDNDYRSNYYNEPDDNYDYM